MPAAPRKFREGPFTYHQEIELEITSLTNLGAGVGRIDGWVIFVPYALPEETVRARVFRNHAGHSEADLIEVVTPSPHRRDPVCPLFGTCGGCQYQNFTYDQQLEWKRSQVAELLDRHAGLEIEVLAPIPSPKEYNYRSKITPHFEKPRNGKIGDIGFKHHARRGQIIDVEQCPIATEAINAELPLHRARTQAAAKTFKKGATLLLRDTDEGVLTNNKEVATETVGDITFTFLAGDFFQNNPFILPAFVDYVATAAAASGAKNLVDAYCGSGLFGLSSAKNFEHVVGIEISETAIDWAKQNAAANNITNASFQVGDAASIFIDLPFDGTEAAVIIDPPRKGSNPDFLGQLVQFAPRTIVYVSCNPATQIRDLAPLVEAGYKPSPCQPFDLFPQTRHLEAVITLTAPER